MNAQKKSGCLIGLTQKVRRKSTNLKGSGSSSFEEWSGLKTMKSVRMTSENTANSHVPRGDAAEEHRPDDLAAERADHERRCPRASRTCRAA